MSTVAQAVGKFVWHEQVSSDPKQAQEFYTQLFGWDAETFGDSDYTMISSGGRAHGGYGTAMEGAPPPHWLSHIQVDDVDATIEKTKEAGGSLAAGPFALVEQHDAAVGIERRITVGAERHRDADLLRELRNDGVALVQIVGDVDQNTQNAAFALPNAGACNRHNHDTPRTRDQNPAASLARHHHKTL